MTHEKASFCQCGIMDTVKNARSGRFLCLTHTSRDHFTIIVCILELYSAKINLFLFSTNSVVFLGVSRHIHTYIFYWLVPTLISFILKCYPLSRINFLFWKANFPSDRINIGICACEKRFIMTVILFSFLIH